MKQILQATQINKESLDAGEIPYTEKGGVLEFEVPDMPEVSRPEDVSF